MVNTIKELLEGLEEDFKINESNFKSIFNSSKVTDHYAIIPTISGIGKAKDLSDKESKIYNLIKDKLLASCSDNLKESSRKIRYEYDKFNFNASGKTIIDEGYTKYLKAYGKERQENELPDVKTGDKIKLTSKNISEKFTKAPSHYNEDTLLKAMENAGVESLDKEIEVERKGLGTPATRAGIIENLIHKDLIRRDKKNLLVTEKGNRLVSIVEDKFKSAETTSEWEMKLAKISSGAVDKEDFLREIEDSIRELVDRYRRSGGGFSLLKILELFGGIGAIRKAFINLKIPYEVVDYVEIDKACVKSYNALYGGEYRAKSVVGYKAPNEKIDLIMHGSPCQDFSRIGKKQGGVKNSGTRSSLLFETIRIIKEMKEKPKWIIWENVKGVLDRNMRDSFFIYLKELESLGYESKYKILNAMDFGIPQKRERIFVVSCLGLNNFSFNKLERKETRPLSEFLEKDVSELYTMTQPYMLKFLNKGIDNSFRGRLKVIKDFSYTISTKQMRVPNSGIIDIGNGQYRYLTERECLRLMGFDDSDIDKLEEVHPRRKNCTSSKLYKQAGNSIVVDVLIAIIKEIYRMEVGNASK